VRAIATALHPYLDKPFICFGHSMGALISFELARFLRHDLRCQLLHLFVSGRCAPHIPAPNPPIYTLSDLELRETLRRFNGTPTEVLDNEELMRLLLPTLRADFKALETYHYTPSAPLECPITALGGLHDPEVSIDSLEAWREHTIAPFSTHMFSGDHFFLHTERAKLLQFINHELQAICNF
jgi:medium-chain acyl-[acyl-carrier-protein] hydrolase